MEISGLYSNNYFGGAMELDGGDHRVVMSVDSRAGHGLCSNTCPAPEWLCDPGQVTPAL